MRWSIIRVIWLRELRDQLRDRRTILMIVILPLVLYPLAGFGLMQLALGRQPHRIGIVGAEHVRAASISKNDRPSLAPLLTGEPDRPQFNPEWLSSPDENLFFEIQFISDRQDGERLLNNRGIDALIIVPDDFSEQLQELKYPAVTVLSRTGDDHSLRANVRVAQILDRWRGELKRARFQSRDLPEHFDRPFKIDSPELAKPVATQAADDLFNLLVQMFPFVLVMWSLAGALYPAVDLCAGEKERGTMETLLISPARREEIVWGKFLAIWVFSAATALLNLASMALTTTGFLGNDVLRVSGFLWGLVLLLPLSAFFSAVCLAVGAYARSTKEGQYYLMPLFLVTMPLMFLTLVPGVELNPFYSMVPVTGVALLLQKLLTTGKPDGTLGLYFIPVLAPMVAYGWLALRWAIDQFKREEVLFREASRWEFGLWLRNVFREKEARPGAGQAFFCFAMIFGLSWLSLRFGHEFLRTTAIRYIAFVATPTLAMAFILTTAPRESMAIRIPQWWYWPFAIVLVILLLPPLAGITVLILKQFPVLQELIRENRPLAGWMHSLQRSATRQWLALAVFAWLPAICEELAFRGFILTGLQRRFRPRTAVVLSSFLFALAHLNVFQFIPTFLLGLVLAYLTTRCGSVLPSMLFHLLYNTVVLGSVLVVGDATYDGASGGKLLLILSLICAPLGLAALWRLTTLQPHPAFVEYLRSDAGLHKSADEFPSVKAGDSK